MKGIFLDLCGDGSNFDIQHRSILGGHLGFCGSQIGNVAPR